MNMKQFARLEAEYGTVASGADQDCRNCARRCSCIEGRERETNEPLVEVLSAIAIGVGFFIGILLTVAYAEMIKAACLGFVKWVWL